jgi:hypothetical protein
MHAGMISYNTQYLSPDSVVPDHYNSQDLNRYAYVRNNPIKYNDPSGHRACGDGEEIDCNGRKYEKPVIQEPPLGDSHFIVGVMIPDTMLKPLGESDPTWSCPEKVDTENV